MEMKSLEHAVIMNNAYAASVMEQPLPGSRMAEERLPFTVRVVRDDKTLRKAIAIRQAAYSRHVPEFGATLGSPEPNDHDQGSLVLLAESRMDGSPVGTMRIQTNRFRDLAIERSAKLPAWLKGRSLAEATRLGVAQGGSGRVVKIVLCKAFYLYCLAANIEWMVIAARPPLDRPYEAALFKDVYPGELVPLRHAGNIPHRVLAFEVDTAAERWNAVGHSLSKFMVKTWHPDIDLSGATLPSSSRRARGVESGHQAMISA
jgi:hypothetical protein